MSSCYKLYVYFRNFSYATFSQIFSLKRNEKVTRKLCGTQNRRSIFWSIRGDVELGCFILLSAGISKEIPKLTYLYFFSFLKWPLKHNCPFADKSQVILNNYPLLNYPIIHYLGIYSLAIINLQSTLHAPFTLAIYPLIFVASIECADSTTLNGKNTYCTFF